MAVFYSSILRRAHSATRIHSCFRNRILVLFSPNICVQSCLRSLCHNPLSFDLNSYRVAPVLVRNFSNNVDNNANTGVVARFKQMYKDYWYVLVPVHIVTSICWGGGFYYLAKSGVDVVALLKTLGVTDRIVDPLKDSSMGYYALAYALYKIATPIRYTVTVGGTTISIKYLKNWGYIKPMPSREELKEMYQVKKEGIQDMYEETRQELRQRKDQIRERKEHVMNDIARYKQEMRETKENELKKNSESVEKN